MKTSGLNLFLTQFTENMHWKRPSPPHHTTFGAQPFLAWRPSGPCAAFLLCFVVVLVVVFAVFAVVVLVVVAVAVACCCYPCLLLMLVVVVAAAAVVVVAVLCCPKSSNVRKSVRNSPTKRKRTSPETWKDTQLQEKTKNCNCTRVYIVYIYILCIECLYIYTMYRVSIYICSICKYIYI